MAETTFSKIDQLAIPNAGGSVVYYDIDLPYNAAPSIRAITLAQALNLTAGLMNYNSNSFYLPTISGSASYTLATTADLSAMAVTLNGSKVSNPSFYAPTTYGTEGQYLIAHGENAAPTWSTLSVYTAGTGLSSAVSGTVVTFNHINSITSMPSAKLGQIAYDSVGHITSFIELGVKGGLNIYVSNNSKYIGHVNNITSSSTGYLGIVAYDSQGHITSFSSVGLNRGIKFNEISSNYYIGHESSITSMSNAKLGKIAYDSYGHITSFSEVTSLPNPYSLTIRINNLSNSYSYTGSTSTTVEFYAPPSMGNNNQVLMGGGILGSSPVWVKMFSYDSTTGILTITTTTSNV